MAGKSTKSAAQLTLSFLDIFLKYSSFNNYDDIGCFWYQQKNMLGIHIFCYCCRCRISNRRRRRRRIFTHLVRTMNVA